MLKTIENLILNDSKLYSNNLESVDANILSNVSKVENISNTTYANLNLYTVNGDLIYNQLTKINNKASSSNATLHEIQLAQYISASNINSGKYYITYDCLDFVYGPQNGFVISQISPSRNEIKIIRDFSVQNDEINSKLNLLDTTMSNPVLNDTLKSNNAIIVQKEQSLTFKTNYNVGIGYGSANINSYLYAASASYMISTEQLVSLETRNNRFEFIANRNFDNLAISLNLDIRGNLIPIDENISPKLNVSILVNGNAIISGIDEPKLSLSTNLVNALTGKVTYTYIVNNIKIGDNISFKITSTNTNTYSNLKLWPNSSIKFKTTDDEFSVPSNGYEFFLTKKIGARSYFRNIFLKIGPDVYIRVINMNRDASKNVYTLKLYEPVPVNYSIKTITSLVEKHFTYGDIINYDIILNNTIQYNVLKSPNFNLNVNTTFNSETTYKTWNSLLNANLSSVEQIASSYISHTFGDAKLNVDYSNFSNFIFYSSAVSRVATLFNKILLLESYNDKLNILKNVSSSYTDVNILEYISKRSDIISNFDDFEKYIYYTSNSGSLYTFSTGSIQPWPKQTISDYNWLESYNYLTDSTSQSATSSIGYNLKSSEDTEVINYKLDLMQKAVAYDNQNINALYKTVPSYILSDNSNSEFVQLIYMIGHYYDNLRLYIQQLTNINLHEEHINDGVSNELLKSLLESDGWKISTSKRSSNLWSYVNGADYSGSYLQTGSLSSVSYKQYESEILKRIYNNLPFIYKTKGTIRSIEALMNCYGIPANVINIKEYGGPSVNSDYPNYTVNKYAYSLYFNSLANNSASIYWSKINNNYPNVIQFQFKPDSDISLYPRTLLELSNVSMSVLYSRNTSTSKYGSLYLNVTSSIYSASSALYNIPMYNDLYTSVQLGFYTGSSPYILLNAVVSNNNDVIYNSTSTSSIASLAHFNTNVLDKPAKISEFNTAFSVLGTAYPIDLEVYVYAVSSSGIWSAPVTASYYYNGTGLSTYTLNYYNNYFSPPANIPGITYYTYIHETISDTWWYDNLSSLSSGGHGITITIPWGASGGDAAIAFNAAGFVSTAPPTPVEPLSYNTINIGTNISTVYKFQGNLREFRYWSGSISNESMIGYALNPLSYFNTSISSSFNELLARIPLTYKTNVTSSIISVHPNQQINRFANNSLISMNLYNFTASNLVGNDEIFYEKYPSIGANNLFSDKIRIENNNSYNVLNVSSSVNISAPKSYSKDSPLLGIFMSPQDMIDSDIANQLGYLELDNYIGDPSLINQSNYPNLSYLQDIYWKKYSNKHNIPAMLKVLQLYDFSFFEQVKQLLPLRVNAMTGVMIKPNILERNKVVLHKNSVNYTTSSYNATIDNLTTSIDSMYTTYTASIKSNVKLPSIYVRQIPVYKSGSWITQSNSYDLYQAEQPVILNNTLSTSRQVKYPIYSTAYSASILQPTSSTYIPAEVQDYSLDSYVNRKSRYEGTKISSPSYNAPSSDLPNNDPVIQVIIVNNNSVRNDIIPITPLVTEKVTSVTNPNAEQRDSKIGTTPITPILISRAPISVPTPVLSKTNATGVTEKTTSLLSRVMNIIKKIKK